jgi:hypothetical protein
MEPQHEGDRGKWSMPEYVKVGSIMVKQIVSRRDVKRIRSNSTK